MPISIISNRAAMSAQAQVAKNNDALAISTAKISSGQKYSDAGENAAAVVVGTNIKIDVAGMRSAQLNTSQGLAMAQTAESAVRQIGDLLVRLKSLTIQSQSEQISNTERSAVDSEYQALLSEIDRISADTKFNGKTLVGGENTSVTNINDMGGSDLLTTANGISAINFNQNKGDGALKFDYDATTRVFTATDLETGSTQTATLSADLIAVGSTETLRFGSLGAEVIIDSNFDKTSDLGATNTASVTGGTGVITAGTIELTAVSLDLAAPFDFGTADTGAITLSNLAAPSSLTLTMTLAGTAFTATGVDLTSTGTKTVTLTDADSNTIEIQFDVGTVFDGNESAASLDILEMGEVAASVDTVQTNTTFNFQVGTGIDASDMITMTLSSISAADLGLTTTNVLTTTAAKTASNFLDLALTTLNGSRAELGAAQSRLEAAAGNLQVSIEEAEKSRSSLMDIDIADEITKLTTSQALLEAGINVLSRANLQADNLLQLLRQ